MLCSGLKSFIYLFFYTEPFISHLRVIPSIIYQDTCQISGFLRVGKKTKKTKGKHTIRKTVFLSRVQLCKRCLQTCQQLRTIQCGQRFQPTALKTRTDQHRRNSSELQPRGAEGKCCSKSGSAQDESVSFDYVPSNYWTEVSGRACETFYNLALSIHLSPLKA